MRISTITNWAYGVTLLLTGLSGAAFLIAAHASEAERAAVQQHLVFDTLAEELEDGAEQLSDEARLFAVTGQARHFEAFRTEAEIVRTRDHALERVHALGASVAELAAVNEAERNLGELDRLELMGVEASQRGDRRQAQRVLFGPDYERAQAGVASGLANFRALVTARTQSEMRQTQLDSDRASLAAKIMLALTALVFLSVLYFVLRQRVAVPLRRMTNIVMRLARQDYAVEVPKPVRRDEIGDMTQAIQIFRDNGIERERLEAERRADQLAKDSILQMMHRLQACETQQELAEVVICFAPQTFPELAGGLYVYDEGCNALALAGAWRSPAHSAISFPPTACWGVRRGHTHASGGGANDVSCPHINRGDTSALCVPLAAQGETIGLLYFEEREGLARPLSPPSTLYLELMSENIALALANLRLRERLANLASHDALTGLMNRRSLDEALNRCAQDDEIACIMMDIDHFKRFNDEFGHDAGDAVMQHVAQIAREVIAERGCAYRFGGEEFTVLAANVRSDEAMILAETLRTRIAAAPLAHHGRMLGHITVSLGFAVSPEDGPPATLLRRADAALLRAKSSGRNRTVSASQLPHYDPSELAAAKRA